MSKKRFEFGQNWREFLENLTDERIIEAEKSLQKWLDVDDLHGKSFLDIGSGSGLFSLAARNTKLGKYDVVYSWGVLHHTGNMYQALENAGHLVADHGTLFIAIYNDQGRASKMWKIVKKAYNSCPKVLRGLVIIPCFIRLWGPTTIRDILKGRPFYTWRTYVKQRGMYIRKAIYCGRWESMQPVRI